MIEKIKTILEHEDLIPMGSCVVLGVSGGIDSMALLHVLHRMGIPLVVAHLNHSIRGAESDADEVFVKKCCRQLGVECMTTQTDVPAWAEEKGISLEMAAREARHAWFTQVADQRSNGMVMLAHHADDQLETFFLRAARGAGVSGLCGMKRSQSLKNITLIRPMLGIRRVEIFQWVKNEGIEWREDSSNSDEQSPRNRVRYQMIPTLEKINPNAAENILRSLEVLRAEDDFMKEYVRGQSSPLTMDDDLRRGWDLHWAAQPKALQRRMVQDWLIENGVQADFDSIERVIRFFSETHGSKALDLEGLRIISEYGKLRVVSKIFSEDGKRHDVLEPSVRMKEGFGILRGPWKASISRAKIAGRKVTVRTPRPGDRMNPYGMEGSKKLQDIFVDLKIPRVQRAGWPVVECGEEIIWLPGYRIARHWELADDLESALHLFADLGS